MSETTENFNERLRKLRVEQGYTQSSLAKVLNVSRQSVQKWESGASKPDISLLRPLAQALHVSMEELLQPLNGQPKQPQPAGSDKKYKILFCIGSAVVLVCMIAYILLSSNEHFRPFRFRWDEGRNGETFLDVLSTAAVVFRIVCLLLAVAQAVLCVLPKTQKSTAIPMIAMTAGVLWLWMAFVSPSFLGSPPSTWEQVSVSCFYVAAVLQFVLFVCALKQKAKTLSTERKDRLYILLGILAVLLVFVMFVLFEADDVQYTRHWRPVLPEFVRNTAKLTLFLSK